MDFTGARKAISTILTFRGKLATQTCPKKVVAFASMFCAGREPKLVGYSQITKMLVIGGLRVFKCLVP